MSLDKAIKSGKEHRKPYRGAKKYDPSCRNNGGRHKHNACPYCENGRLFNGRKKTYKEDIDRIIEEEYANE